MNYLGDLQRMGIRQPSGADDQNPLRESICNKLKVCDQTLSSLHLRITHLEALHGESALQSGDIESVSDSSGDFYEIAAGVLITSACKRKGKA